MVSSAEIVPEADQFNPAFPDDDEDTTGKKKSKLKKLYVVDTNVLLFDPQALFKLGDADLVIPISVIEEMDRFKRDQTENGRNARQFSRYLDALRKKKPLNKGAPIGEKKGRLTIELVPTNNDIKFPKGLNPSIVDNQILLTAFSKSHELKDNRKVILITKDTNLRIKADALGIPSADYEPSDLDPDVLYSGSSVVDVDGDYINDFMARKSHDQKPKKQVYANEFFLLKDRENPNHTALGRWDRNRNEMLPLYRPSEGVWGIFPKNAEQAFAFDLLLNDNLKLVSLVGKAGTGKTLLALAAGLQRTVDEGVFTRLLVSRPVFPLGKDIGYLPGDLNEKLNPWMQPIFDNLDFLFGHSNKRYRHGSLPGRGGEELMNQGMLSVEPLTYIRGRSIPQQYMIVDEAQNLTPHEIKTIITRSVDNTKIILTGDTYQIDNPYVDSANNGLTYVVDRFKDEAIAGHITLSKGERSELAELASNLL
jgi:PhoH-like ATPase